MASQSHSAALTLQDKVAIVTGASRGIGAGLALELARRGAKVSPPKTSHLNDIGSFLTRSRSSTHRPEVANLLRRSHQTLSL